MTRLEEIVARYYTAFNTRDFGAYAVLLAPDAKLTAPGIAARGIEATQAFDRGWCATFPEARVETFKMLAEKSHVVCSNWFHGGPQRGALQTPGGDIPATGNVLSAPYCSMFRIQDGRIVEQQLLFEPSWIPIQLGVV
jgi:ketosteroid isomerase-like protein